MLWNMLVNVQAVDVFKKGTLRITRWPSVMSRTYVNHVPLLSSHDSFGLSILTPLSVFISLEVDSSFVFLSQFCVDNNSFSFPGLELKYNLEALEQTQYKPITFFDVST